MNTIKRKKEAAGEDNNNIFWTTMSDLMLGLSIIFMTLFILAMTGFTQENLKQQQRQVEVAKQLAENLKVEKIDAEVDEMSGSVKISDVELFDVGSYQLSARGKQFLDKFAPIYVNTVFENDSIAPNIENIIIQGHTDSQTFKDAKTPDEQFSRNMFLSLQRAYAVQDYMLLRTKYNRQHDATLRKILVVEGKSYSEPVLDANGNEDFSKSRRVELKLRVKGSNIAKLFGMNFGAN